MAAITWFGTNTILSTLSQEMSETSPGANATSSPNMGWVVGNAATNTAAMDAGSKVTFGSFVDATHPDGSLVTGTGSNGDHFRSTGTYTGSFAAANWTWHGVVIGVTQAGAADGYARVRLFRGPNADGTGATEITSAAQQGSTITNLSTTQQDSTIAFNPGAFSVSNEYIFIQVAWSRTGAGGMTTTDVIFRYGTTGTRLISADFTVSQAERSASVALMQDADAATITATVPASASVSHTQAADTVSSTATVPALASVSSTQDADTVAATAASSSGSNASASFTQASDTASVTATVAVAAGVTFSQAADTAAVTATVAGVASVAVTQTADTSAITATVAALASIAFTQSGDAAAIVSTAAIVAAVSLIQAADTLYAVIGEVPADDDDDEQQIFVVLERNRKHVNAARHHR